MVLAVFLFYQTTTLWNVTGAKLASYLECIRSEQFRAIGTRHDNIKQRYENMVALP